MGIKRKYSRNFIKGAYFSYCQWCRRDGHCILRHYQFMGVRPGKGVDETPYHGHEDLSWHFTRFQHSSSRAACGGRVYGTEDPFYFPLACECGTVISGEFCQKFQPKKEERERAERIQKRAKQLSISVPELKELEPEHFPVPDPNYQALMA